LKKPYPHDRDIGEAIKAAFSRHPLMKPYELYEYVLEELDNEGFYSGLVTEKRVWRIYEKMVRRGEIFDYLDVVKGGKSLHGKR